MVFKDDSYCEKINTDLNTLIVEEDEINKQNEQIKNKMNILICKILNLIL